MRLIDCYSGVGGFAAGAIEAGCDVVLCIDNDETPLKTFAANCPTATAICATLGLGTDVIDWPEPQPDLHIHMVRARAPPRTPVLSLFCHSIGVC